MPEGTTTNKVVQLKDPTTKEPVSPVVNVGSIYDKNGNKVDNLLSYVVAGTDVPIPEISDIADNLQQQVDAKLDEVDTAIESIDTAINNMEDQVDEFLKNPGLPVHDVRTYPVREGQSISAGDVVNVGREVISGSTETFGDLPVGTIIQLNENGSPVDYLVLHQGNPDPELYDSSCNGTWIRRKNRSGTGQFNSSSLGSQASVNEDSIIITQMESDISKLDSDVQSKIKTVKIPACINNSGSVNSGANGLECRAFPLSLNEMGLNNNVADTSLKRIPSDGAKLDYFPEAYDTASNELRKSDGSYFTRSIQASGNGANFWIIYENGGLANTSASSTDGYLPCYIFDSSALFGDAPVYGPETVYKDVVAQDNVENVVFNRAVTGTDTIKLSDQYSVTALLRSSEDGQAALIDNETGKQVGERTQFSASAGITSVSLARLDDSHFVVCWLYSGVIYGKVGTVTGTTISLPEGSAYDMDPFRITGNNVCVLGQSDRSDNHGIPCRIYIGSTSSGLEFYIQRVGASGSNVYRLSSITQANYISACFISNDDSGNQRVCVCFSDGNDGNKGKAVIATISSSNAVTFGDVVTVETYDVVQVSCAVVGQSILAQFNGTVYKLSFELSVLKNKLYPGSSSTNQINPIVSNSKVGMLLRNMNPTSGCAGVTIDEELNTGEEFYFHSGSYLNYISATFVDDSHVLVAYANVGNSNYGTTTILEVSGNQIAGSFIDNSQDAIALADGTGGQSIPVGFGGYCECPGVTEGETIDSSGVSAYAVQDGWLKIMESYSNVFTGTYTGDGENQRLINIGFKPKFVLVMGNNSGTNQVAICGSVNVQMTPATFANFVLYVGGGFRGNTSVISLHDSGFLLGGTGSQVGATANYSGILYKYIAWR